MDYPKRKSTRIPGYDYSTQNFYFVTLCTHEKRCIFGNSRNLNALGKIAAECMECIPEIYSDIKVDKYVVMPNHVHAILVLGTGTEIKQLPELPQVLGKYKAAVTKRIHQKNSGLSV